MVTREHQEGESLKEAETYKNVLTGFALEIRDR
jgi:hypothetical protein